MAIRRPIATARLDQILLWYDGPQIVLLQKERLQYIVGIALDPEASSFLGVLVTPLQLSAYQAQRFDLRFLMSHPDLRKWFKFSLDHESEDIELWHIPRGASLIAEALPEAGFFARAHSEIDAVKRITPTATERFDIDGNWDLGEFSSFYGQVEDIYHVFSSIDLFNDPNQADVYRSKIQEALLRPFQGGGSYLGFYKDIANDNYMPSQLRVSGIKYNSPGYVELKARKEPFDAMISLLNAFSENSESVKIAYRDLYSYLSYNKLLKAKPNAAITVDVRQAIITYSAKLAAELRRVSFNDLMAITDRNVLLAAKLLLSIERRTARMYRFFEQGRVKYETVDADPVATMDD